jgi:hypothetical protein
MDEGLPCDGLRDAATTILTLDLLTSNRKRFLAGFATTISNAHKIPASVVEKTIESYLVEKGLLPAKKVVGAKRAPKQLSCFACMGSGKSIDEYGIYTNDACPVCNGSGTPKKGSAGYSHVDDAVL